MVKVVKFLRAIKDDALIIAASLKSQIGYDSDDTNKAYIPSDQSNGVAVLKKPSSFSTKRKFFLGLIIVCLIAISWVGSTQTAKSSFNKGFSAPLFVMYFSTSWMMLVFPLTLPLFFLSGRGSWDLSGLKELWKYALHVSAACNCMDHSETITGLHDRGSMHEYPECHLPYPPPPPSGLMNWYSTVSRDAIHPAL